jgi:hypothetical protein
VPTVAVHRARTHSAYHTLTAHVTQATFKNAKQQNLKCRPKQLSSLNGFGGVTKIPMRIQSLEVAKKRVITVICSSVNTVTNGPTRGQSFLASILGIRPKPQVK